MLWHISTGSILTAMPACFCLDCAQRQLPPQALPEPVCLRMHEKGAHLTGIEKSRRIELARQALRMQARLQ